MDKRTLAEGYAAYADLADLELTDEALQGNVGTGFTLTFPHNPTPTPFPSLPWITVRPGSSF